MSDVPKDFFDQELSVGDQIVYAVNQGSSSCTMKTGVITKITYKGVDRWGKPAWSVRLNTGPPGWSLGRDWSVIHMLDRCCKVPLNGYFLKAEMKEEADALNERFGKDEREFA